VSRLRILETTLVLAFSVQLMPNAQAAPPQPIVVPVMQKDLADAPGKEMVMLTVDYPPGAVEHIHRHDAYAFVYVLEGTIVEQVRGGKEVTLTPGQTFYESLTMCTRSGAMRARRSSKIPRRHAEKERRRRCIAR
jgi:Cupin domain